jgi:excisionase family DNA binding protein
MFDPWDDSLLPVEEAAQRMGISVERVVEYVKRGILRATADGLVQVAILSGAVDDSSP